MTKAATAADILERSDHGQLTAKLLIEFLASPAVRGLDGCSRQAAAELAALFLCTKHSGEVCLALRGILLRNPWVQGDDCIESRIRLMEMFS